MFNVFKKVLNQNSKFTQEDIDKVNEFVFCRWLSGDARIVNIANTLNKYTNIPKELQLVFIQNVIGGKVKFIPYPKSLKNDVEDTVLLKAISKFFNISERESKMYMEFLTKEETEYLKEFYNDTLHS